MSFICAYIDVRLPMCRTIVGAKQIGFLRHVIGGKKFRNSLTETENWKVDMRRKRYIDRVIEALIAQLM